MNVLKAPHHLPMLHVNVGLNQLKVTQCGIKIVRMVLIQKTLNIIPISSLLDDDHPCFSSPLRLFYKRISDIDTDLCNASR